MAAVSGEMEDLRAIARVRQIDLRAATLECDELRVQVGKLTQSNTRVRAVNTALLVSKGKWDDQLQRLHELEDQALDMQRCKSDLQDSLKRAHEAEAASVKERDNSLALLDAADARIGELHERVAELEQQTGLAYVGVPSTPAPEPGGFVVSAMAAQRIAQLVGQLTRTSAAMPPNNQHSLELGLASALDAQQDINSAMAVLTGALAPFYVPEKREDGCSDWGALLAACFGDVVFADGLLSKAWTATVQCLSGRRAQRACGRIPTCTRGNRRAWWRGNRRAWWRGNRRAWWRGTLTSAAGGPHHPAEWGVTCAGRDRRAAFNQLHCARSAAATRAARCLVIWAQQVKHGKLARRATQLRDKHVFSAVAGLVLAHHPENGSHNFDWLAPGISLKGRTVFVHEPEQVVATQAQGIVTHAFYNPCDIIFFCFIKVARSEGKTFRTCQAACPIVRSTACTRVTALNSACRQHEFWFAHCTEMILLVCKRGTSYATHAAPRRGAKEKGRCRAQSTWRRS